MSSTLSKARGVRPTAPRARRGKAARSWGTWVTQVVIVLILLGAWQLLSGPVIDPLFISSPSAVIHRMITLAQEDVLLPNAWVTFSQSLVGFAVGAVLGIFIGNVMGLVRIFGTVSSPFVTFFYTLPRIAIAPLFVIWLKGRLQLQGRLRRVRGELFIFHHPDLRRAPRPRRGHDRGHQGHGRQPPDRLPHGGPCRSRCCGSPPRSSWPCPPRWPPISWPSSSRPTRASAT